MFNFKKRKERKLKEVEEAIRTLEERERREGGDRENDSVSKAYQLQKIANDLYLSANYLSSVTENLTEKNYSHNPATGRENVIKEIRIGLGMPEQSVMIVGPGGTGKTAIVQGLAYQIQNGLINNSSSLKDATILELPIFEITSGTELMGMTESKIKIIINGLKFLNNNLGRKTILFIDEIHTLIGMGRSRDNGMDVSNGLKSALARGEIKVIGATTNEEFTKYIEPQKAFKRRFEIVNINEPNLLTMTEIVRNTITYLEKKYKVSFSNQNERETLIRFLLTSCDETLRNPSFFENNPDLALRILKKTFSSVKEEGKTNIDQMSLLEILSYSPYISNEYREQCQSTVLTLKKQSSTNLVQS